MKNPFEGMRAARRRRLEWAVKRLHETGRLNRKDISQEHEVSEAQAALDLQTIQKELPSLMTYDYRRKTYVRVQ